MKYNQNFEGVSYLNFLTISPLKVRRVLDQIRNRPYSDAVLILTFLPTRSSSIILKALNSAVYNLKAKFQVSSSLIYVKEVRANVGPVIKRFRPRAQGRAFSIKKRMSHIIIKVSVF